MHFLFKDYAEQILKSFEEKRDANQLSQLLMHPTTANLRQEFLNVYRERVNKGEREEENTLRSFFGIPPAGKTFAFLIERENADKFRPIQSLIKREIKNPSLVNVELVAWLIDFRPRPFNEAKKFFEKETEPVNPGSSTMEKPDDTATQLNNETTPEKPAPAPLLIAGNERSISISIIIDPPGTVQTVKEKTVKSYSKLKSAIVFCLFLAIMLGVVYLISRQEKFGELPYGSMYTGCMYWAGEEYVAVPCNEEKRGRLFLPLDPKRIKNFKRIMMEDTITERSINVVFYISMNNIREYYTMGGHHPLDITRNLRPLSRHIYDKYLAKKETAGKDSMNE
ncbi:MAG: hypothetical protein NTW29_15555 [Bacteroidetes bacterium]|nr:hypothetical protein [Bacteroidota bacterium]